MLSFEVVPGKKLGPFVLGMPIGQAIRWVQEHEREINLVEFQFGVELEEDVCLDLKDEGLRLHFGGATQTLQSAHVYQLGKLQLTYETKPFAGVRAVDPSLLALYQVFGPSYPGEMLNSTYQLNYPGLGFAFPIPPQFADITEAPVELPDGSVPLADALLLFKGRLQREPEEVSLSKVTAKLPHCAHYLQPVVLEVGKGIRLPAQENLLLPLRCHVQEVRVVLGEPQRTHSKTDARLQIHARENDENRSGEGQHVDPVPDYFMNYTEMGLDVLVCGTTQRVLKYVAHSNLPTHDNFYQYARCNWTLVGEDGEAITYYDVWSEETRKRMGIDPETQPVVHNRPAERGQHHLSTYFYGRSGLIVEVLKSDQIETVQIDCK